MSTLRAGLKHLGGGEAGRAGGWSPENVQALTGAVDNRAVPPGLGPHCPNAGRKRKTSMQETYTPKHSEDRQED